MPLPRVVRNGDDGTDIHGHKRALAVFLGDVTLKELEAKPTRVKNHFGEDMETRVNRARKKFGLAQSGTINEALYSKLRGKQAYDAYALSLIHKWAAAHPPLTLCYPITSNINAYICQGLHPTSGVTANWAIDFCAPPLAPIVAVEKSTILRLSGSDPDTDRPDNDGVYGWSIHYVTPFGYHYFLTHLGRREQLTAGQVVQAGDLLGYVGDQDYRPDHIHLGVTSPLGETDAKNRITAVSKAPKVTL